MPNVGCRSANLTLERKTRFTSKLSMWRSSAVDSTTSPSTIPSAVRTALWASSSPRTTTAWPTSLSALWYRVVYSMSHLNLYDTFTLVALPCISMAQGWLPWIHAGKESVKAIKTHQNVPSRGRWLPWATKATQVFTAICNSVSESHILCHMVVFNSSANQNKLKLYTCAVWLFHGWL